MGLPPLVVEDGDLELVDRERHFFIIFFLWCVQLCEIINAEEEVLRIGSHDLELLDLLDDQGEEVVAGMCGEEADL